MTLDEAILRAEEVAEMKKTLSEESELQGCSMYAIRCGKSAEEHRQLAEWLRELKAYKEQDGDTIDRQAAIHIASGYCHPANVADELSKLPPVRPKQRWIPVSERLPEDEQEILFSTKTGRVQVGKYHDDDSANQWYSYRDKCRAWNNVVTAWMPLPEPYNAEREG